jgi:hypothetical protein
MLVGLDFHPDGGSVPRAIARGKDARAAGVQQMSRALSFANSEAFFGPLFSEDLRIDKISCPEVLLDVLAGCSARKA